jgi:hypothetical protein
MVEDLPEAFQDRSQERIGPWQGAAVIVARSGPVSNEAQTVAE